MADTSSVDARNGGSSLPPESGSFVWPVPPHSSYPLDQARHHHEPCDIVGLNGRLMHGRLNFFVPEQQLAHIQVPPARTTMPLRFGHFQSLLLTRAIVPRDALLSGPAPLDALAERPHMGYRVVTRHGDILVGDTIGHVNLDFGLFLFPPVDEHGAVRRLFIPREVIDRIEFVPLGAQPAPVADELTLAPGPLDERPEQAHADVAPPAPADVPGAAQRQALEAILGHMVQTPSELMSAIEAQSRMPMVRIGEALITMGLITEDQLHEALSQQQGDRSVPLGELLVRLGLITRQDLLLALARKMGYPVVDLARYPIDPDALHKVPFNVAVRLSVVPLYLKDNVLVVAVEDPSKRLVLSELEFVTQCKVKPVLGQSLQLELALRDAYGRLGADVSALAYIDAPMVSVDFDALDSGKLVESLEREGLEGTGSEDEKAIEQSDNSLVRLINTMIIEAYSQGVSDIHVESHPGREKVKIRFRKDGLLVPYLELPHNYRSAMIARIKIMCDLDISERRKPQDGKINFVRFVPQYRIELRVATIPTNNGLEDVVMRILSSARPMPLDKLGLSPANLGQFKEALERPYGLILCVGPTGSGKTTTLHSALSYINVPERKIWTAEDPVEITQPGLRQVQVNPKIDWTFAKALRAFLRADPDVIMIGEMRDEETASMGIEASLTGHLVLTTLHTNSAPETVTRLLDMGMDPFSFADALLGVMAQRLVRRLCVACRVEHEATPETIEDLLQEYLQAFPDGSHMPPRDQILKDWMGRHGHEGVLRHYSNTGCEQCNHTGFKGRLAIHELMLISRDMRRLIQTGSRAEELQRRAMGEGMRTLRQDGIEKVLAGLTSIEEVRATSNT
ncbi:ATPase, T2SS/T4P/T4SS family [Aquabacterium sp. A3]|uniref:GspE/PulE family protein n=1 Tax=Aquabacterium sp. A3 TaxID=3132829 RepID=UPI0031194B04